MIHHHTPAY